MYKESDRASTLITKIPAVSRAHKSNPYRHRCSKSWCHLILPLYGKSPPISPTRSSEKTQTPCQNSDTLSLWILPPFEIQIWMSCPVVLVKNSSNPAPLVDKKRKMTYFPPCITYRISRILIKHFLVHCFSNYRSLEVRPITGQSQFSELQSTFFFF